jgi:HAD superfamily hydrolase (TIGR01509 family)
MTNACTIKGALFDFGGVIADEGFRNGLYRIARSAGLDPGFFLDKTREAIYGTGYLLGSGTEAAFWDALRRETGVGFANGHMRDIILEGFTVRPWMLDVIRRLKGQGVRVAILSDQTDWLHKLEEHMKIFGLFERVFNSYHLGKSKLDPSIFTDVLQAMGLEASETLFVDDTPGHVDRAMGKGLRAILFTGKEDFLGKIAACCPGLDLG